jgi:PKD repeat protein
MKKLFLLIFLFSYFQIYCTYFNGYVYDVNSLSPIPGAVVMAGGSTEIDSTWVDTTDVNGFFELNGIPINNDYTVMASALNYISRDTILQTPPETYNFYLISPTTGNLVETINEGLQHYEHNGEYWFRTDGEVYENVNQNFFFDIDAENDTINALMEDIGAGTVQTDDDLEIRDKLAILWLWMQDNCVSFVLDSLTLAAHDYLLDHSDGHYYTISALASTFAQYGFIPWGSCMSRANIFVTLLYKTGVPKNRIAIGECRWKFRYSQHMYLIINLFDRWYHFDPTHLHGVILAADGFHSKPSGQVGTQTQDHTHLWKIYIIPGSSLTQIPLTTYKERNPELFIRKPPEKTHTINTEITLTGYADGTVVDSIIVQNIRYPVVSDSFTANAILSPDENNIEVNAGWSSEYISIVRDYHCIPHFSTEPAQGNAPLEVQFQDNTELMEPYTVSSCAWDFTNDGIIDSLLSNPTFTYNINGTYTVKMIITILDAQYYSLTRENVINVYDQYIEGYAYLTGESDHTGIVVELFSQSGSVPLNQIATNSSGYYRLYLETGSYYLKFSYPDFFSMFIYNVNVSGNETLTDTYLVPLSPLIIVPDYFMTIGNALDFAQNGDTIRVRPGIYNENLDLPGKSLTLESFYAVDPDTSYISGTVISGNRSGSIITIYMIEDQVMINGFTIANGNGASGGGVYIGGAEAEVTLQNLRFINNTANNGGFYLNNIRSDQFSNITVLLNESGGGGGGGYIINTDDILLDNLIIDTNISGSTGGGLYLILCDGIEYTGLDVVNNTSFNSGGGLFLNISVYAGGAMTLSGCDSLSITNTRICGNQSNESHAGAIKSSSTRLFIYNAVICDNHVLTSARNGGAFYMNNNASTRIINSTIQGNSTIGHGSAFYITSSSNLEIYNCIVADNYDAETVYVVPGSNTFASNYSDYFGNDEPLFSNCNDSLGVISGTNYNGDPCDYFSNIFLDPEFMTTEDFHLFFTSPCIKAGTPDTTGLHIPPLDLDSNPRIYGDIIDMGAYEFQGITELPVPVNIVIIITDAEVIISWDAVPHATSYQVYSSLTAYQGFLPEQGGNFSRNREIITWSKVLDPEHQKKFYQVRAVLE